ncbi:MAG: ABC transporter substrate-binding protein [Deltaproteobacteria bacterium]|jgi:ABC-type transport system substrate-binding protein|nr:ABC transporter substrate-binding protein [Deltaproteobacteria bacterium]
MATRRKRSPLILIIFLVWFWPATAMADTLRLVYPEAPKTLDPQAWPPDPAAESVIMTVYGRLIGLKDNQGQLDTTDSLAYTIRVSDDDLMYTVRMREGLTFSDGKAVNAVAALYTFDRLMATEAGRNLFPHLKGFNIIGDYTFSLVLNKPWPPFLASLALPQASLISPGLGDREKDYLKTRTLGSGRFTVAEAKDSFLALALRSDLVSRPKLDRVEFYFEKDAQKRLELFNKVSGHILAEPPEGPWPSAEHVPVSLPSWETLFLAFNLRRPYLGLPGVREALALMAKEAYSPAPFKPRGYFPLGLFSGRVLEEQAFSEDRIKELIYAAGAPRGPLDLVYPGGEAWLRLEAEKLQAQFSKYGLPVNVIPLTGQAGQGILESGQYDLYLGRRRPEIPSPEMWLGRFLDSKSAGRGNPAYFAREAADSLLGEIRASLPRAQREQKLGELEVLAERERPYVFLSQLGVRFLVDRRLAGLKTHPMWPTVWPISLANLNPFRDTRTKKTPEPVRVREFNEQVAEPWE